MNLAFALTLLAASPQTPAAPETVPLAMTRSGVRLEVVEKPQPGALEVRTAWGMYYTPRDPVAIVMDAPRRSTWRTELEADPNRPLGPTIAELEADGRVGELLELIPILEARLLAPEVSAQAEQRRDELLAATRAVSAWGGRLDPLPGDLSRAERLEELWKRARKAKGADALLPGGRLLSEITPGGAGVGDHQLSISDLRDGMDAKNAYLRRVAFQISGKEVIYDGGQNTLILLASLDDGHPVARDGAADGIVRVWPEQAREYWIATLLRWKEVPRHRAAWHLVHHLPQEAAAPLVGTLASSEERVGRRFEVGDLTMSVVKQARQPARIFFDGNLRQNDSTGASMGALPRTTHCPTTGVTLGAAPGSATTGLNAGRVPRGLTNGSTAKVTAVTEGLSDALSRALAELTSDRVERDVQGWVSWYEAKVEEQLAQKP